MATITKGGRDLGRALAVALDWDDNYSANEALSLIIRNSKSLVRIGEALCNGPDERHGAGYGNARMAKWQTDTESAEARKESRIAALVASLASLLDVEAGRIGWENRSPYCVVLTATDARGIPREVFVA